MNTIAQIIEASLNELFERGVIDLPPSMMEMFEAECEIEYGPAGMSIMVMFPDWIVFVTMREGKYEAYYSMERERVAV